MRETASNRGIAEEGRSSERLRFGKIIDITRPLSPNIPRFPGTPHIVFEPYLREGGWGRQTTVTQLTHSGTHWDAQTHLDRDGTRGGMTISDYPIGTFIGRCVVVDISDKQEGGVLSQDFEGKVQQGDRVLFKTRNSIHTSEPFDHSREAGITGEAAKTLQKLGVVVVGIDSLTVSQHGEDNTAHEVLLNNGIPILEGLDLSHANEGLYILFAPPMNYQGLDGAQTRAVLFPYEE
jgi:arylformamidase